MSPDLVMEGLRGLAAVLSIGSSVKNLSRKNDIQPAQALEVFKTSASPEQMRHLQDPRVVESAIAVMVITQALLSQLADEAKTRAKTCMCRVLQDIRDHNNGNLPGQIFEDWWDAYQCA